MEAKTYHLQSSQEVLEGLGSSRGGLTGGEAARRLGEYGHNKLTETAKTPAWKRFLGQLKDPMIIILIAAAVVSAVIPLFEGGSVGLSDFADTIIIAVVVLLNAVMGVVQESKAEQAIDALKKMTAAHSKVLRDGQPATVPSEELVPGDVILLEAGDAVPADARILECASMKCEESAMTGESVPVDKSAEALQAPADGREISLGDRRNMLYMGSTIVYGRGTAVVTGTGMHTEMGKIAGALNAAKDEKTPLQEKLTQLSRYLTWLVLGICVIVFVASLLRAGEFTNPKTYVDTFIVAVSLAVAAIPEGLATVVTIVLSMGVTKMSKQGAVIRKLSAVETLGCTQIICSDKTGTLTQNKMTVVETREAGNGQLLATAMALCSDAELDDKGETVGEPTECALVAYANQCGLPKHDLKEQQPRIGELPFDSDRKLMTTVHRTAEGILQYTKGAPDCLLARCSAYFDGENEVPMSDALREQILAANKGLADKALRVLAAAYRRHAAEPAQEDYTSEKLEQSLVFCGLTGMIDPVRPEVKAAIDQCRSAGIRPVMITGDHRDTAVAIGMELGIITDPSQAITGAELNEISDEDFAQRVTEFSVYARVQPEHKVRIVKAWKARGMVTAMTGDGVNDAPSIKIADIGVGMGITGTDVTKNVADMILSDDNFATIVKAAEEGRRIYDNIRRTIRFLLSSNLSEVISILIATLLGFTILKPTHLLWINLITDAFPALALGMEAGEGDIMQRPPRDRKEGIFAGGLGVDVVWQGFVIALLTLAAYLLGDYMERGHFALENSADGMTMAFLTMSLTEMFHAFNMRREGGSVFGLRKQNWYLFGAMAFSLIATTAVIYIPALKQAFQFESISGTEYLLAVGLAFLIIPIVELVKLLRRMASRSK